MRGVLHVDSTTTKYMVTKIKVESHHHIYYLRARGGHDKRSLHVRGRRAAVRLEAYPASHRFRSTVPPVRASIINIIMHGTWAIMSTVPNTES